MPVGLRIFVAALAVVDDILSVLTLAVFYPRDFQIGWLAFAAAAILALSVLNRFRVYAMWPYAVAATALWVALHAAGVHGALAGIFLAAFLPTRPAPAVSPLLAQAATALAALDHAENEAREAGGDVKIAEEPVWEWASRALLAASDRLLSPADRIEHAVAPWSAYLILPLFAFSATGVGLALDLSEPGSDRVLAGRDPGARLRQADRDRAGGAARGQGRDRAHAGRRHPARLHRRRLPVRHRRHGGAAAGRPGVSRTATIRRSPRSVF